MIRQHDDLFSFLNSLLVIYPPQGLLLIGAGNGSGALVEFLIQNQVNHVTLVEPQDTQFRHLEALLGTANFTENKNWTLSKEVVTKKSGQTDFYYASNSSESGLLDPEIFKEIWPNLRLVKKVTLQTLSLDELCSQSSQLPSWLMIDCIGALQIFSKDSNLASFDVIVVKVILNTEEQAYAYADYTEIGHVLNTHGFSEKLKYVGQHPNLGHLVFVRDHKSQSIELIQQLDELNTSYKQLLEQHKAYQAKLVAEQLELKQTIQNVQTHEANLKVRHELICNELARAEAQLLLIKEELLREHGL